jgi:hypothetical protein
MSNGESIQGVDLAPSAVEMAVLAEKVRSLDSSLLSAVELARLDERINGLKNAFESDKIERATQIDKAFDAADKATAAALTAQKEAAGKSEQNAQAQLEMHNGLIRKMDTLVAGFPTKDAVQKDFDVRDQRIGVLEASISGTVSRDLYDQRHGELSKQVEAVEKQLSRAYGVATGATGITGLVSVAALLIALTH